MGQIQCPSGVLRSNLRGRPREKYSTKRKHRLVTVSIKGVLPRQRGCTSCATRNSNQKTVNENAARLQARPTHEVQGLALHEANHKNKKSESAMKKSKEGAWHIKASRLSPPRARKLTKMAKGHR